MPKLIIKGDCTLKEPMFQPQRKVTRIIGK